MGFGAQTAGFQNPITGNQGTLERPAIKSPNYVAGVSGWTINRDGSVEFNNGTFRGIVTESSTFVYSGAPAAGNLIASVTNAATDPQGNATIPGITSYATVLSSGVLVASNLFNGSLNMYTAPSQAGPWTQVGAVSSVAPDLVLNSNRYITAPVPIQVSGTGQALLKVTENTGAPSAPVSQIISHSAGDRAFGIEVTGDGNFRFRIDSNGRHDWGPGNGVVDTALYRNGAAVLQTDGTFALTDEVAPAALTGASELFSVGGQVGMVNSSGHVSRLSCSKLAAVNTNTVTGIAFANLFNDTVEGDDAKVGSTYRAVVFGFGVWGSTQQALTFGARWGATDAATIGTTPQIAATALAANATFRWKVEVELTCVTTGVNATWVVNITGCITQTANAINPGTAANNTIPFSGGSGSGAITLDSTINHLLGLSVLWASTTGAPTITAVSGRLERVA